MQFREVTLKKLADKIGGTVVGDGSRVVKCLAEIDKAGDFSISPFWEQQFAKDIIPGSMLLTCKGWTPEGCSAIEVENPRRSLIDILEIFGKDRTVQGKIHQSAVVPESVKIGKNVFIGPNCILGENVILEDNVVLMGNNWVGDNTIIGAKSRIEPGTIIYDSVSIGKNCIVHSNAVIGSDGFGFMPDSEKGLLRIPQIGTVTIEDNVEIGTCTCIDRATFGDTHIGKGTKIDALVKIGHNCKIGKYCISVAQSGIAGSSVIGDFVTLAAQSGVANHATVGDKVTLCARAGVAGNIKAGQMVSGFPAREHRSELRQHAIARRLPDIYDNVKKLNAKLKELESKLQ